MIYKNWICVNELLISNSDIETLYKSFGDRLKSLKVNKLTFVNANPWEISNETIEVLNLINPCTSSFRNLDWSYDTLKMLFSLNSENIEAEFENNLWVLAELEFTEVNIVMFDSIQNYNMKLKCRSTIIDFDNENFENICLLKADKYKYSDSDCLFIPFTSVMRLKILEFKVDKNSTKNEKHLTQINEDINISQGLIIPVNQLSLAIFYLFDALTNSLKENSIVTNELLRKAKKSRLKSKIFWWINWNEKHVSRWFLSYQNFTFHFQFYNFKEKSRKWT